MLTCQKQEQGSLSCERTRLTVVPGFLLTCKKQDQALTVVRALLSLLSVETCQKHKKSHCLRGRDNEPSLVRREEALHRCVSVYFNLSRTLIKGPHLGVC